MALIECPECNHEVSDKSNSCPNCGINVYWHTAPENGTKVWQMIASWVLAFIFGVVLYECGVDKAAAVLLTFACAQALTFFGFPLINRSLAAATKTVHSDD